MGIVVSESHTGIHCDGTCETSAGCMCHAMTSKYTPQPTPDFVHGPTDFGAVDNKFGESEQSMVPSKLFVCLLIGVAIVCILLLATIPHSW
jgi:hypothetical protein